MASFLSSGHSVHVVLPQRLASFAVQSDYAVGRAVPIIIMSLLSHFERPIAWASPSALPWLYWGVLPCPVRGSIFCHVGPLGFVNVRPPAGFYSRRSCSFPPTCHGSFHVPCPSGSGVRLPYRLPYHRRREFYLSHLPASFSGLSATDALFTCGSYGFPLS